MATTLFPAPRRVVLPDLDPDESLRARAHRGETRGHAVDAGTDTHLGQGLNGRPGRRGCLDHDTRRAAWGAALQSPCRWGSTSAATSTCARSRAHSRNMPPSLRCRNTRSGGGTRQNPCSKLSA